MVIDIEEEKIPFNIREKLKRHVVSKAARDYSWQEHNYRASGQLTLRFNDRYWPTGVSHEWSDEKVRGRKSLTVAQPKGHVSPEPDPEHFGVSNTTDERWAEATRCLPTTLVTTARWLQGEGNSQQIP